MNHYEKLALDKLAELKGQLQYVTNALNEGGMEAWEAKEFAAMESSYIEQLKAHVMHMDFCRSEGFYA